MADRVAVMHQGQLVEFASPHEVYANPRHEYTARLIGGSSVLEGRLRRNGRGWELDIGVASLALGQFDPEATDGAHYGLAVKPEHVRVGDAADQMPNRVIATVRSVVYGGPSLLLTWQIDGTDVRLRSRWDERDGAIPPERGTTHTIGWSVLSSKPVRLIGPLPQG